MFGVLLRARRRMLVNAVRSAPRWQKAVVGGFSLFAVLLFLAIAGVSAALILLAQNGAPPTSLTPAGQALIDRMEEYLFFFLLAGSVPFVAAPLFQADDLTLLLSTPISTRAVVGAKLLEAILVNAAQFVVLGVPVLIGVGAALGLSFSGWLWLLLAVILLLTLPPAATALLLLLTARLLGMRRVRVVVTLVSVGLGLAVTVLAVVGVGRAVRAGTLDTARIQALLRGERVTNAMPDAFDTRDAAPAWLPSAWAAAMLKETAGGRPMGARGALGLLGLAGTSILLIVLCLGIGPSVLALDAFLEAQDIGQHRWTHRRRAGPALLAPPTRGLLLKDQKYVLRDLILLGQIGTALILFLVPFLLRIVQGSGADADNDLYGELALAMLGLIVYMVTSIVALSSVGLEGRGFWLVLASPVSRGAFLRAKWLGAFLLSAGIVSLLTLVTWRAFALAPALAGTAWLGFVCACFALSGLGVGLAGLFPRFVYENPAHRASVWALILGFVLATGYLIVCSLIAVGGLLVVGHGVARAPVAVAICGAGFLLVSALTGAVPVLLATRRLKDYAWEF